MPWPWLHSTLLVVFPQLLDAALHTAPLQIAAKAAGCSGSESIQTDCVLRRLFAPSEQQALVDANWSRLPSAPPLPIPGVFETLLRGGDGLVDVPLSNDKVAVLGSGTGRLPILAALVGVPHVLAVEKEPESFARSVLALQRLRDLLNNFGDDLVDHDENCKDRAAKGECSNDFMAANCTRTCYNRTHSSTLRWKDLEVHLHQGASNTVNLSNVTLAILAEDGVRGPDRKEVATLAMKLEVELSPGAMIWSLDPLPLEGVKVQETLDGKTSLIPAGGLVFLRRLHLNTSWSNDVPCHIYIRVPGPSPSLRPNWPLNNTEAKRLLEASTEELVALGAIRLSGAVLSEGRFAVAAQKAYGMVNEVSGRRLTRAFGVPAAALGSQQDFCRCRPRENSAYEVSALNLLGMFLLAVHAPETCMVPPCTASDGLMALLTAELRRQLLAGHKESCDVPPQVMRDLGCLRFSDQRTLLHAALGRKDLQLARAALRSQGAGGMFCRDAFGLTALHHAAQGKPQIRQVNHSGLERVNSSEAVDWVLKQMRREAPEMLKQTDHSGRSALLMAEDVTTLRLLSDVGSLQPMDFAGRGIAWHAVAANRTDILQDLYCNCTESKQENCEVHLSPSEEDIRVSPLLLASTQLLHPSCKHLPASKVLDVITNCTGQDDFNLSLDELVRKNYKV